MEYMLHDVLGNLGVLLIVTAYLLLLLERLSSKGLTYPVVNALGALLILVSLSFDFNLSAFVMEVFWLAVSMLGIAKFAHRRRIGPA